MEITAFLMGTAHPHRINWLKENVEYLDSQHFPFSKKLLSIDQFNGYYIQESDVKFFENKGWTVLIDSYGSRVASLSRALDNIDTEFIFYNEDDVLSTLPKIEDLEKTFNTVVNNRKCGMISMTLGGIKFDASSKFIGDLKHINENIVLSAENYDIFLRMEEYRNDVFFEFPGLFIRTNIFKMSHQEALKIGGWIETALTSGYFNNEFDKIYYKASVCKKNALDILNEDASLVNSHCRLLHNLDPKQGNGGLGGGSHY
jgi:hypothetical protein